MGSQTIVSLKSETVGFNPLGDLQGCGQVPVLGLVLKYNFVST